MDKRISKYMSKIGSKGGKKSKRVLTTEQAKSMVYAREQKKFKNNEKKS